MLNGSREKRNKYKRKEDLVKDEGYIERKNKKRRLKVKNEEEQEQYVEEEVEIGNFKKSECLTLNTRSSPAQLNRCVHILRDNQEAAVKKMGFGKLLNFKVDSIPAKLGHFVVDSFDVENMEIKVPGGNIKVDVDSIHELLGIPNGGVKFESITPLELLDDKVFEWRSKYPGRFVAPSQLVNQIENANDEDNFEF